MKKFPDRLENEAKNSEKINDDSIVKDTTNGEDKVDESKVNETVKMIEDLLKEQKKTKTDGVDDDGGGGGQGQGDGEGDGEEERKRKHGAGVSEEEKQQFFKEKNIQVNLSTNETGDTAKLAKKPKKKSLKNEMTNTDKELKTISTQTPRDVSFEGIRQKEEKNKVVNLGFYVHFNKKKAVS